MYEEFFTKEMLGASQKRIFATMKKSFADIVRETEAGVRQRLRSKVPQWASVLPELELPSQLNVEQCSSSATARYKAGIAAGILDGIQSANGRQDPPGPPVRSGRIADLTGGLGVDAWAFSETAAEVLYNEMDATLCDAVRHNFALLGVENVTFRCEVIRPGSVRDLLKGFRPDLIFLDPARRSVTGRKVFLLEDCSPDLVALQDELLAVCPSVLVKLSPMADITLLRRRLKGVTEVHVVAVDGECKELLLRMDAGAAGGSDRSETGPADGKKACRLTVVSIRDDGTDTLSFEEGDRHAPCPGQEPGEEDESLPDLCGRFLFEPGAALTKSECHAAACCRAGLRKLSPSTHLYVADAPVPALAPFGRFRQILEVQPLDKRSMADVGRRYPQAEVTARGIPMSSEELRARLGVRSGGPVHIYGAALPSRRILIVTQ